MNESLLLLSFIAQVTTASPSAKLKPDVEFVYERDALYGWQPAPCPQSDR